MDIDKLIVIWSQLKVEEIKQVTPEKLVEMSLTELEHYVEFLDKVDPTQLKNMSLKDIEDWINTIWIFRNEIKAKASLDDITILVNTYKRIKQPSQKPQKNTAKKVLIWVLDTTEKIKQAKDILSTELYQAIWEKSILDERMTKNKLIIIKKLTVEDIKQITPEKLVEMKNPELYNYITFLDKVDPNKLKNMSLEEIEDWINTIWIFKNEITPKASLDEITILVNTYKEIKKNRSIKN